MLKTILLLDGSEAMNSSADYLPTRLLALRLPLVNFIHAYLDANPLASLGIITMRDGVAYRLNSCTTNIADIIQTLEAKYFLFGGSGALSLENGLRLSLSELVDLRRIAKRVRQSSSLNDNSKESQEQPSSRLRIILISSSVTIIDPHDIFVVLKMVTKLNVIVDVISFCGAVHIFEQTALVTGGVLYTPMNYDHFTEVLRRLAVPDKNCFFSSEKPMMIQIGFPTHVEEKNSEGVSTHYLACPQCALIQTSIPSTCPLCKLLICSVPLIHSTFIASNNLCPSSENEESVFENKPSDRSLLCNSRCSLCRRKMIDGNGKLVFWRCSMCRCERCASCESYIRDSIGLCPTCIAFPAIEHT